MIVRPIYKKTTYKHHFTLKHDGVMTAKLNEKLLVNTRYQAQLTDAQHLDLDWFFDKFAHLRIDILMKSLFLDHRKKRGHAYACDWLGKFCHRLEGSRTGFDEGLPVYSEDSEIIKYAHHKADRLSIKVKSLIRRKTRPREIIKQVIEYLNQYGLRSELEDRKRPANKHQIFEEIAKVVKASWWRRKLRSKCAQEYEQLKRELMQVCFTKNNYVSNHAIVRRQQQESRNRNILESMLATNQHGEAFTLAELADKSTSNPVNKSAELIARTKGFEEIARELGMVCRFYTLTAPSKFHAVNKAQTGICYRNQKYKGFTPKDASRYLQIVWSRVRAKFHRENITPFGFRVCEPHHDATPHYHILLFFLKEDAEAATKIFKKYAIAEDIEELQTRGYLDEEKIKARFKADSIGMDKAGETVAYIIKYISKNIESKELEENIDIESNLNYVDNARRATVWAGLWNIRQFQQIGGASVTAWRLLRKLSDKTRLNKEQAQLSDDEKLTGFDRFRLNKIIHACARAGEDKKGCFAEYTRLQGGPTVKRNDQIIRIWNDRSETENHNITVANFLFTTDIIDASKVVKGIKINDKKVTTSFYDWKIQDIRRTNSVRTKNSIAFQAFPAGEAQASPSTWSCITNCTHAASSEELNTLYIDTS